MSEAPTSRRVALVTGASRGIGRAIAKALVRDGLFVVANYVSNDAAAQQTLAELGEGNAALAKFDVASESAVDAAVSPRLGIHRPEGR